MPRFAAGQDQLKLGAFVCRPSCVYRRSSSRPASVLLAAPVVVGAPALFRAEACAAADAGAAGSLPAAEACVAEGAPRGAGFEVEAGVWIDSVLAGFADAAALRGCRVAQQADDSVAPPAASDGWEQRAPADCAVPVAAVEWRVELPVRGCCPGDIAVAAAPVVPREWHLGRLRVGPSSALPVCRVAPASLWDGLPR